MARRIVSYAERPELDDRWDETVAPVWPEFLLHGSDVNERWSHLFEHDEAFQCFLVEEEGDEVLAVANTIPFAWDGEPEGLPGGVDDVLATAITQHDAGEAPNTLCALQAVVTPGNQGKGLAGVILAAMRDLASSAGFVDLVAPVRPSRKDRYPLQDLRSYARWTRPDGLPFDPWLRVHVRAGAEFVAIAERSQTVQGTVAAWESWTGMIFPDSGAYVVPRALVPVQIDRERDMGRLVEPNYWMRHRL